MAHCKNQEHPVTKRCWAISLLLLLQGWITVIPFNQADPISLLRLSSWSRMLLRVYWQELIIENVILRYKPFYSGFLWNPEKNLKTPSSHTKPSMARHRHNLKTPLFPITLPRCCTPRMQWHLWFLRCHRHRPPGVFFPTMHLAPSLFLSICTHSCLINACYWLGFFPLSLWPLSGNRWTLIHCFSVLPF